MQASGLSESRYYDITGIHDGKWIKYMQEKFYIENEHYIHTKRQMTEAQLDEWIPRLAFVHISKLLEEEKEISSFEQLMEELDALDEKQKIESNATESRKVQIITEQREIYQGDMEKENNNGNIKMIDISTLSDVELENTFFHYSLKKDKNSIDSNGLKAQIGRNSKGIDEKKSIFFSKGIEGALETWDVWLKWRANRLFNPYYQKENQGIRDAIENGTASEQEKHEYYYKCEQWNKELLSGAYKEDKEKLEFLYEFQMDEMSASNYYTLDLIKGEEFTYNEVDESKRKNIEKKDYPNRRLEYEMFKEMYGSYSDFDTLKVDKWNMHTILGKQITIRPDRIKQLTTPDGRNDVLSVVEFLYDKYKQITPKEEQVQFDLLDKYMEYVKEITQNKEYHSFNRNDRIDGVSTLSHFHDQKSDVFFKDESSKIYTITPNQIGKKTVNVNIEKKDVARNVVQRKIDERINSR